MLDYAIALGLEVEELQLWESLCCDVEFGLFSLHETYHEVISDTLIDVETLFSTTSTQVVLVCKNLKQSLKALRSYQRELSQAHIELFDIFSKLREL